jgi:hypothetical protein
VTKPIEGLPFRAQQLPILAAAIRAEHEAARATARSAVEHALKAGELLLEAKSALSHGEWLPWLREHCSPSERQAQKYMLVFSRKDELELKSDSGADLTLAGALASLPAKRDRRCEALALERAAREARPAGMPPPERCYRIYHSACADLIKHVTPESSDWIVTDPPYGREFLPCYSDLARFAAEALKPGGGCLVMTGQSYLPEVICRLQERLEYCWTISYHLPRGAPNLGPANQQLLEACVAACEWQAHA